MENYGNNNEEEYKHFIDLMKNKTNLFEEEYDFLKNKLKNKNSDLIIKFLEIKVRQHKEEEYYKKILEIVLSDKELILKGKYIFNIILDKNIISPKIGNEENKEKLKQNFLSFTNKENKLFEILEKEKNLENNIIIDEILLYLFESYVNSYFDSIKGEEQFIIKETLFGLSLDYLDKSLTFIESVLKKNNILYEHIGFLLSIVYLKCYLVRMIEVITYDNKLQFAGDISIIMKTIEGNEKNKFRFVIKLFLLKLIRNKTIDYESFLKYDFSKLKIEFIKNKEEFNFEETLENILDYFFLPLEYIEKFDESFIIFYKTTENQFITEKDYFISLIKEQKGGFDIFITHLINKLISNYTKENYIQNNKQLLNSFSNWNLEILNNTQSPEILKTFITLFSNPDKFLQSILPNISKNEYEIFLFSFRLISNC